MKVGGSTLFKPLRTQKKRIDSSIRLKARSTTIGIGKIPKFFFPIPLECACVKCVCLCLYMCVCVNDRSDSPSELHAKTQELLTLHSACMDLNPYLLHTCVRAYTVHTHVCRCMHSYIRTCMQAHVPAAAELSSNYTVQSRSWLR